MIEQKLETKNIGMEVNVWDLVSQVIESRRDSRDVIREFLSNAAANEINASNIKIIIYLFNIIFCERCYHMSSIKRDILLLYII